MKEKRRETDKEYRIKVTVLKERALLIAEEKELLATELIDDEDDCNRTLSGKEKIKSMSLTSSIKACIGVQTQVVLSKRQVIK